MATGVPTGNVWKKAVDNNFEELSPPVMSLAEIMSEELAEQIQEQDLAEFDQEQEALEISLRELDIINGDCVLDCTHDLELALQLSEDPDCSEDIRLALQLQREFDREAEMDNQFEQNGNKKGSKTITLSSDHHEYSKLEEALAALKEDGDWTDDDDDRELATELSYQLKREVFPPCGFLRNDKGEIITKHNKDVGQRRNCQKMMAFPCNFKSGDILESRVSSQIYNELQMFSKAEAKRSARVKDKDEKATSDASLDARTRLILWKWINSGELDQVEEIIAIGKESTVLHAVGETTGEGPSNVEVSSERQHFAAKVYKQNLNAFRNRSEYVKNDFRFKNPRSILRVWAQKEYMNLQRLNRAEMPCPKPIHLRGHVLLMTMIGDGGPAPKLKDVEWQTDEEKSAAYDQVQKIIINMYKQCKLVHGDLSEFNLLYFNSTVYVIDVAQAVDLSHPRSLEFLSRDIENILTFFHKIGTPSLPTEHESFAEVTGLELDSSKNLGSQAISFEEQNRNTMHYLLRTKPADYELTLMQSELNEES